MNLARLNLAQLNNFKKIVFSTKHCVAISNFRNISQQSQKQQKENVQSKTDARETSDQEETTHFGFETVKASEKDQKVREVFENVANSYDLMNDLMSAGIHRYWKDVFVERLGPVHGMRLLDMAGGTGDIAFRYLKYLRNQKDNPHNRQSHVTISDINELMLGVGQKRAEDQGLTMSNIPNMSIEWKTADAEKLPFEDNSFNAYTIAFGIRNCTHIDKVLSEAYRVLKPGGRFLCLEFSTLTNSSLQWIYDQYSFQVIPPMGQIITGKWQPYKYLVESIRQFPKQDDFKQMIEQAGFQFVQYENLTFGMVSIHSGFKFDLL